MYDALDLAYQVQSGQAIVAGYFGGYSAKMQDVGIKECQALEKSISRKNSGTASKNEAKAFHDYSQRLVRDLEGKGVIRTSVETTFGATCGQS